MTHVLESQFASSQKSIVMSKDSAPDDLRRSVNILGVEIGKAIIENYFLTRTSIETPMKVEVERFLPRIPLCAIVTTKDDFEFLGHGISSVIGNCIKGYMDFQGQRGSQALTAKIMHMELPEPKGQNVNTLIVAKAVLATGCTAIHLTKTAINKYFPRNIIIASIFYSEQGLAEIKHEIPNADILVVGSPDYVNDDGMLVPGVGDLDLRLRGMI